MTALVEELRGSRKGVVWVAEMLPKPEVIQVLSHTTVFVCPSIYEPMGIVNLEAMACRAAVVATATGGIPEVVADGETGLLVPIEQVPDGSGTPLDPDRFTGDLAAAITQVLEDPVPRGGDGRCRAPPRGRPLLVGDDRRAHGGGVQVRASRLTHRPAEGLLDDVVSAGWTAVSAAEQRGRSPPPPRSAGRHPDASR